jgi:amino acid adenylation domain-containing protein
MKKNLTVIFLANAFALLSGVITSLLTAWALGAEGRGDLAVIVLYPNIVALAVGLGMPHGTRYFVASEPQRIPSLFPNAVYFALSIGLVALAAAEFIVPSLVGERSEMVMWLVRAYLINIPCALLYDMMAGMLEGAKQFRWAAVSRIFFFGIQCVAYTVLWMTDNLTIANAAFTMVVAQVANTTSAFLSVLLVLKPGWKPNFQIFKDTVLFGIKYHLGVVTSFTTLRLDQMLLVGMATSIEMGLYVIAVRLSEIMTVLASSVSEVLMPEIASSKDGRSMHLLMRSLRQTIYVFIILMVPLLVLAPYLLQYAFGTEFLAASSALRILLVASMVWSAGAIVNSGLNGLGYPGLSTLSRLSSAVITVITLLVWLPKYGILGAALSSLAGYSAMFFVALFWLMRKQKLTLREIFHPQKKDIPMKEISSILRRPAANAAATESTSVVGNAFAHQLFEEMARQHPQRVAVTSKHGKLTYSQLNAKANQLAWCLSSRGAGPDVLIPICVDRSADMAIGILGILKSGAAFVPIDPTYPGERISQMIADSKATVAVTQSGYLAAHAVDRLCLDLDGGMISTFPSDDLPDNGRAEDLAYVIFTSGSTGRPKGAMLTNANLAHYVTALQKEFHLTKNDKYLHLASIGFSSSRRHLLLPLTVGAEVVIADEHQRLDPVPLFQLIKGTNTTVFDAVPSFQRHCVQTLLELEEGQRKDLLNNDLRLIVSASEPLFSDIPRIWMKDLGHSAEHIHMFGQTETSGIIALNRLTEADVDGPTRPLPVGRPICNTRILLLDDEQKPVMNGEAGEIYVSGAGVGRGYLATDHENSEKFINLRVNGDPEARYCRTGDHARLAEDGGLECLGRNDSQVKVRGNRVELTEIEALFLQSGFVQNCVAVAGDDGSGEIKIAAYVVAAEERPTIKDELLQMARAALPTYMQPAAIIEVDEIPLGVNGKVDRKVLISELPARLKPGTLPETPGTGNKVLDTVRAIWTEILAVSTISEEDNFFSLGGHSLMASRMVARVRSALAADLHIRSIFDVPELGAFCQVVESCAAVKLDGPLTLKGLKRPDHIPLSFAQRRVWFLSELDQDLTAYNEHDILKLTGIFDEAALRRSLERMIERHEAMRTSIGSADGEPFQRVREEVALDLELIDVSTSPDPDSAALEVARAACDTPFDLVQGPLFRFALVRTAPDVHFLTVVLHHTISDQWTTDVFLKELNLLYASEVDGSAATLPPLPIQYPDYALQQQAWLETDDYQSQLNYWRNELSGAPGLLELPTDHPRPPVQRYCGSQVTGVIPPETADRLKELCDRRGITLFMALLSAWELLLFRYSGQDQLVVGTPIAGRNNPETENLIGFFVNTLAIRADLSGNPTFEELLVRNKEKALGAFSNQEFPFEKLVEELNPERNGSYTPIFQVMFTLQNAPRFEESIGGLILDRMRLKKQSAKFDLSLDVFQRPSGLELQLEFSTDLFEPATAQRILDHLQFMIASLLDDPEQHVNTVGLLTDNERAEILDEWNSSTVEVPPVCVHHLIEDQAARVPDSVAVQFEGHAITYKELDTRANQLARHLIRHGAVPGDIVGLHFTKCIDMVVAVLGVMKSGGAYLPMDPNYPIDRLQYMRTEANVSMLVTQLKLKESALQLGTEAVVYVDGDSAAIAGESEGAPSTSVKPEDLIYVTFTSGSTGRAKGVMIEHRMVVNAVAAWEKEYRLSSLASHLQMASFSFDVFTGDFTRALCSGARLVLCPPETLLQPEKLEQLLTEERIESAEFVPAVIRPLMEHAEKTGRRLDHLKLVVVGSDTWQTDEYRRLRAICGPDTRVINSYGITEATIDSTFFETDDIGDRVELVPIGRPFANTQMYILDQFQNPVPTGFPGEVYQGGNGLARGYLNRPDLTAEKFLEVSLPFRDGLAAPRLYRTGDLGKFRNDGTIVLMGRADNQVKLRGYRIELGEIESVLSSHPDVGECVVILREDVPGDKRLVAYIRTWAAEFNTDEVRAFVKELLPGYMVPTAFIPVTEWKLTPNGKIDRKALPEPASGPAGLAENNYAPPETDIEIALAEIWCTLLRAERIGVEDDFFDLGGHSLMATQVISRIRDAFGCELPLRTMFETPTIRDIGRRVNALIEPLAVSEDESDIEKLLLELESMTEEEAAELLAAERHQLSAAFSNK